MADVLADVMDANNRYAASLGERGKLPLPPARQFAILTCMDARLDPAKYAESGRGRCARDPQRRRTRPSMSSAPS